MRRKDRVFPKNEVIIAYVIWGRSRPLDRAKGNGPGKVEERVQILCLDLDSLGVYNKFPGKDMVKAELEARRERTRMVHLS